MTSTSSGSSEEAKEVPAVTVITGEVWGRGARNGSGFHKANMYRYSWY